MPEVRLIGVCGGSGSGKSTFTDHLVDRLGPSRVGVLSFDAYYRDLRHLDPEARRAVNFDHPDSLDVDLFTEHLDRVSSGSPVPVPVYDFAAHTRVTGTHVIEPRPVVIVEGILLLAFPEIVARLHRTVFLDVPAAVRLERRVARDVAERGRRADDVRRVFAEVVQPMHERFVEPGRTLADHVVDFCDPPSIALERLLADIDEPALAA